MSPRYARAVFAALILSALLAASACKDGGGEASETDATASPSEEASPSADDESAAEEGPVPETTEAAVARFEDYLHALGEADVDTLCEIAAPAAKIAEDEGFGPCQETYGIVIDMISPEQAAALQTATVDEELVETKSDGGVHVPVEAVEAEAQFSEEDLGSYTLAYQDENWFIVD
ncbi:MAG: hypothetical protein ACRDXX_00510 [Stackebrandtia sp.]